MEYVRDYVRDCVRDYVRDYVMLTDKPSIERLIHTLPKACWCSSIKAPRVASSARLMLCCVRIER